MLTEGQVKKKQNEKHPIINGLENFISNQKKSDINKIIGDIEEEFIYIVFKKKIIKELKKLIFNGKKFSEDKRIKEINDLFDEIKKSKDLEILSKNFNEENALEKLKKIEENAKELIILIDSVYTTQKTDLDEWIEGRRKFFSKLKFKPLDNNDHINSTEDDESEEKNNIFVKMNKIIGELDIFKKQDNLKLKKNYSKTKGSDNNKDGSELEKSEYSIQSQIDLKNELIIRAVKYNKSKLKELNHLQQKILDSISQLEGRFKNYEEIKKIWEDGNSISNISKEDFEELKKLDENSDIIKIKLVK